MGVGSSAAATDDTASERSAPFAVSHPPFFPPVGRYKCGPEAFSSCAQNVAVPARGTRRVGRLDLHDRKRGHRSRPTVPRDGSTTGNIAVYCAAPVLCTLPAAAWMRCISAGSAFEALAISLNFSAVRPAAWTAAAILACFSVAEIAVSS